MSLAIAVDHVSFMADDLDESMKFYVDLLGCEPVPRPDFGFRGAWLQLGAAQVHLLERNRPGPHDGKGPSGFANHVAFSVGDYDATLTQLRAVGLEVREGGNGIRQMFVHDPAGNVIELIERRIDASLG